MFLSDSAKEVESEVYCLLEFYDEVDVGSGFETY